MHIQVNDHISLSAPGESDLPSLVEWLKDRDVHERTLQIPYPYTPDDASAFLELVGTRSHKFGRLMDWAIRLDEGKLIGMISFQGTSGFANGHDEIGFWLAKPYWGQGIMTEVVEAFIGLAFDTYRLTRLEAKIFLSNLSSKRVVSKCGFKQSGKVSNAYFKDGQPIDAELFVIEKNW